MTTQMNDRRGTANLGRDAVVDAAIKNMGALGYHGTTMRDIARDAHLTVAAIYHHFASKQAILRHIVVRVLEDSIAVTRAAVVEAGEDPREQLRAFMKAWVMVHAARPVDAIVGNSEMRSLDDESRRIIVQLRDEQEQVLKDVITAGVASGVFLTPVPNEAVRAALNMGSAVPGWYDPRGPLSPGELGDRYAIIAVGMFQAT